MRSAVQITVLDGYNNWDIFRAGSSPNFWLLTDFFKLPLLWQPRSLPPPAPARWLPGEQEAEVALPKPHPSRLLPAAAGMGSRGQGTGPSGCTHHVPLVSETQSQHLPSPPRGLVPHSPREARGEPTQWSFSGAGDPAPRANRDGPSPPSVMS